jgi:hypothetical protein
MNGTARLDAMVEQAAAALAAAYGKDTDNGYDDARDAGGDGVPSDRRWRRPSC